MTVDELREHLNDLIERYVLDKAVRKRLLLLVERDKVPARGVLIELAPFTSGELSEKDKNVIGDIAFHFC